MRIIVVTGTGTAVGKTVTSAALATCALRAGQRVAVVKPIQTGVGPGRPGDRGDGGDLAEVRRLTGLTDLHEYLRYAEPLAPATAARRAGQAGPELAGLADRVAELADRDLVVIEGAGGALVRFNATGEGILELAAAVQARLADSGTPAQLVTVLVCRAGLGTLHDTAAAAAALDRAGAGSRLLVIGDWPGEPGLAERCNLADLPAYSGLVLAGVLPSGAGRLPASDFVGLAAGSLSPALGGTLDAPDFTSKHRAPPPRSEHHDSHR